MVYKIEQNGRTSGFPYFTAVGSVKVALSKRNDGQDASCVMVSEDGHHTVIPFKCSDYSYDNERIIIFATVFLEHPMSKEVIFQHPNGDIKIVKEATND